MFVDGRLPTTYHDRYIEPPFQFDSKIRIPINTGDHQQLRPSVNVHELATKFQLDVSLFERLIVGDMKPVKLGVQHRMRPEVARLIVPAVYAHLENHSSVYSHPHIPGMQHDVIVLPFSFQHLFFVIIYCTLDC